LSGIKVKQINLQDETKQTFDTIQAELCSLKGYVVSQDETLKELIKNYNEQKVK
jgi:hypothetical protein